MALQTPASSNRFFLLRELTNAGGGYNQGISIMIQEGTGRIAIRKLLDPSDRAINKREYDIMRRMAGHPNIVQVYGFVPANECSQEQFDQLFMAYCKVPSIVQGKELNTLLHLQSCYVRQQSRNVQMPELFIWHFFESMLKALCLMQFGVGNIDDKPDPDWAPIRHRDIHAANIFISSAGTDLKSEYPRIVLGDFGRAYSAPAGEPPAGDSCCAHLEGPDDIQRTHTCLSDLVRATTPTSQHSNELWDLITEFPKIKDGEPQLLSFLRRVSQMREQLLASGRLRFVPLVLYWDPTSWSEPQGMLGGMAGLCEGLRQVLWR